MGLDSSYIAFDRAKLDSLLDKTFRQLVSGLNRKTWYEHLDAGFHDCYQFAEGYEQEKQMVDRYLDRSIRDALSQNDLVYWMLILLLDILKRKGTIPQISCGLRGGEHEAIILGLSARGFMRGDIGVKTLYAVVKLHYISQDDPLIRELFQDRRLKYNEFRRYAKTRKLDEPLFGWQQPLFWDDGNLKVNCLKPADFHLWRKFLSRALKQDWLKPDIENPAWSVISNIESRKSAATYYRRMYYGLAKRLEKLSYNKPVIVYCLS